MIDDGDSVQWSEYCFNVCEALKNVVEGGYPGGFDERVMEDLERCID